MRTTFSVYAPSTSRWITPLHEALRAANGLQSKFKYELVSLTDELETKRSTVNVRKLDRKLAEHHVRGLVICDQAFKDGLVVVELLPERVYVTTQIPRKGPAPRLYLMYQLAAATLSLTSELGRGQNRRMIHDPPVGCLWDWWVSAKQRTAAMLAARICPSCRQTLSSHMMCRKTCSTRSAHYSNTFAET